MALNITFSEDLLDRDEAAISDIKYRGYHKESDTWSDWYDSGDETQYNINLGDSAWLGQEGEVHNGDHILLMFETKEDDPLDRQFAVFEIVHDGSDTYTKKVKLQSCQAPNVIDLWKISSATDGDDTFTNEDDEDIVTKIGRINSDITATQWVNDNYEYDYDGTTFMHTDYWYEQDVFSDRIGIEEVLYDWTEDDNFVEDTTHQYTEISQGNDKSTEVEIHVKNKKDQISTNILKIQIRYNLPIADMTWDPEEPNVTDEFKPKGNNSDVDSRITAISYKFDGTEVDNNTTLDYEWTQDLGDTYQETHTVSGDISWNDGFNDYTIENEETVHMTNIGPTFTLTTEVVGEDDDNDIKFTPTDLTDPDGDDEKLELKWIIEYKTPFDNTYKVVYNPGYPSDANLDPKEWIFDIAGEYRITAVSKDEFGLETSVESIVSFESGSNCDGSGQIRLNNNVWQLISVPVRNKAVNEYFLQKVDDLIKTYDDEKSVQDVVEVVNAYPGQINKFLSFIPGITSSTSEHNFPLVMSDGGDNINEVLGFWVKVKDYYPITEDEDLIINWNQAD